jgi:hypothetical protein
VIHPLYPLSNDNPKRLAAGKTVALGEDGSFVVQAPFGKEMVFAFLFADPPASLTPLWAKDYIGKKGSAMKEQQDFLDSLWQALIQSGKPKGLWTSRLVRIESFKE